MPHASFSNDLQDLHTILDVIRFGISQARSATLWYGHGTDNAEDDIYALVLASLSLPWNVDPVLLQTRLTSVEKAFLAQGLEQRIIQRIPVPYITHTAQFCELTFYVDERVLIPRSPFAELIQQQFAPWVEADKVTRVLDMCTGSACIAIACCYAFPDADVDAVDISLDALAVAAINRERHQVQTQLTLIESDGFEQMPAHLYDIILSNPPYVSHEAVASLPAEYHHEPALALEAEDNGLAFVKRLLAQAADHLTPQGVLIVEVGLSEEALIETYPDLPFVWLEFEHGGEGVFVLTAQQLRDYFYVKTV
jgi:ribosomal protein L3 glutamine methyltransferase